jgi:hypothetical protein
MRKTFPRGRKTFSIYSGTNIEQENYFRKSNKVYHSSGDSFSMQIPQATNKGKFIAKFPVL